ncbi:MAG: hypothetical protein HOJ57_22680 [Lentisphaerae bacterium]|nr:hypothetical protein [Verrucomicrobiota bacterium]MBT5608762.1 hypothetical protein [Lentisphaerota bacterium]MBT7060459.1 hypothetical protein [Lentisphaerota bacterium]
MGIIADILRRHAPAALSACTHPVPLRWYRALRRITSCRTVRLGGCVDTCPDCGHGEFAPYSCRDRLCPVCRGSEAASWLEARRGELLPVPYFHFVVTVPTAYSRAVRDCPHAAGKELMQAVAEASQAVACEFHGGELGILAVLHTWGRNLSWHAHMHCLIPGVVLRPDGSYKVLHGKFLLPLPAFKKIFPAILTRRFRKAIPGFDPPGQVWRQRWNAKVRACVEGPGIVLKYLARYVRTGPLHEAQIVHVDDQQVAFRYLNHRTSKVEVWCGAPEVFVRRYLQHALPRGLHRIRYYGFLGPSRRRTLRALQVGMIARFGPSALAPTPQDDGSSASLPCPQCGSTRPRVRQYLGFALAALRFGHLSRAPPCMAS